MATLSKAAQAERARVARVERCRREAAGLKLVADGTRLLVLSLLAEGELHVGALCAAVGQSQPAVSHHLALTRHAGLVTTRRDGKRVFYAISDRGRKAVEAVAILTA